MYFQVILNIPDNAMCRAARDAFIATKASRMSTVALINFGRADLLSDFMALPNEGKVVGASGQYQYQAGDQYHLSVCDRRQARGPAIVLSELSWLDGSKGRSEHAIRKRHDKTA